MQICTHLSRFALISRVFPGRYAKKYTGYCIIACVPMWQREKDLNPRIRSQSPLCYHYTIPLKARIIIPFFTDLSRANFRIPHIF